MIRKGFRYKVRFVKQRDTTKGPLTEFQIGCKIKDSDEYFNVRVTVWQSLDIADGDEIRLGTIQSITPRQYNGKVYYDMVADIEVEGQTPAQYPDAETGLDLPFSLD